MLHTTEIEQYVKNHTSSNSLVLNEIYRRTNLHVINPRMLSGQVQGMLLSLLSHLIKPKSILEIGTFTGYSAVCLAQGLSSGGMLHTIEVNDEIAEHAIENFKLAKLEHKITLHIGNAIDIIPNLNLHFDLIFIDGEKREYPQYYKVCKQYLSSGGLLAADNVLWDGKVVEPLAKNDTATKAVIEFNTLIQNDPQFVNVLLPLRDGLMLARKL